MIITYHGGNCIRASAGDTTLAFSPISKKSKNLKPTNFGADVVFVSLNHPDMNGVEQVARGEKEPFTIQGAGEYEVGTIFASGFSTVSHYDLPAATAAQAGKKGSINTAYAVVFDGLTMLYLGALSESKLPSEVIEDLDTIDVLFVPIGNDGVLSASEAQKLAVSLEAKIVIPIHYGEIGDKNALKQFLKESGAEDTGAVDKLTIKPKDVADKSGEVVVLKS
jgi:L-ascorbate metabolism protein UlaG (beta-lactamase superfamily)